MRPSRLLVPSDKAGKPMLFRYLSQLMEARKTVPGDWCPSFSRKNSFHSGTRILSRHGFGHVLDVLWVHAAKSMALFCFNGFLCAKQRTNYRQVREIQRKGKQTL